MAEPEQVIFDLRSPQEKEFVRLSKNTSSFKLEFDLWKDRPQLITSEIVGVERGSWSPTVHHLERQGQILHITVDGKMAAFTFHTACEPFTRLQRIRVRKHAFNCAMLVPDMRPEAFRDANSLLAVMFTKNPHQTPCKLMSFSKYRGKNFGLDTPLDVLKKAYLHFNPEVADNPNTKHEPLEVL